MKRTNPKRKVSPFVVIVLASCVAHVGAAVLLPADFFKTPDQDAKLEQLVRVEIVEPPPPELPPVVEEQPPPEPEPPKMEEPPPVEPQPITEPIRDPPQVVEPTPPQPPVPTPLVEAPPSIAPEPTPQPDPAPAAVLVRARPDYLTNPPPRYPRIARERGWEGTVILRIEVLPDGAVGSVEVAQSSNHRALDDAAVEAARRWRFIPARLGNESVRSFVEVPVTYRLTD
jgi:protein TonB